MKGEVPKRRIKEIIERVKDIGDVTAYYCKIEKNGLTIAEPTDSLIGKIEGWKHHTLDAVFELFYDKDIREASKKAFRAET